MSIAEEIRVIEKLFNKAIENGKRLEADLAAAKEREGRLEGLLEEAFVYVDMIVLDYMYKPVTDNKLSAYDEGYKVLKLRNEIRTELEEE